MRLWLQLTVAAAAQAVTASAPPPPPLCPRPSPDANYTAEWCSVQTHPMPQWFEDAKFGI